MSLRLHRMIEVRLARKGIALIERVKPPRGHQKLLVRGEGGHEVWVSCSSTPSSIDACANMVVQTAVRKLKEVSA
jgi:hypothetical protein